MQHCNFSCNIHWFLTYVRVGMGIFCWDAWIEDPIHCKCCCEGGWCDVPVVCICCWWYRSQILDQRLNCYPFWDTPDSSTIYISRIIEDKKFYDVLDCYKFAKWWQNVDVLFETGVRYVTILVIEVAKTMHRVILEGDVLDERLETMWIKIIISNYLPKLVWSLGRNQIMIWNMISALMMMADVIVWRKSCSHVISRISWLIWCAISIISLVSFLNRRIVGLVIIIVMRLGLLILAGT